jgi:hypothetical protein
MMASYAYFVAMLLRFGRLQVPAQGRKNHPPPGATTQTAAAYRGATATGNHGPLLQGFSVVLVWRHPSGTGQDDVPPAARKR